MADYIAVEGYPEDMKSHTASDTGSAALFGAGKGANLLWVGGTGNVVVVKMDDNTVTLNGVIAGRWHKMPPFKRINSTSTTATGLVVGITF